MWNTPVFRTFKARLNSSSTVPRHSNAKSDPMTIWRTSGDWVFEVFAIDTPASTFDIFEPFVALWNSKRHPGILPTWQDYCFEDLADWYGWVTVEDIIPGDTYDSRYRLWGTKVTDLFETELTGKRMSDAAPGFSNPMNLLFMKSW